MQPREYSYGGFYDPVGSHANQPQGYTYQAPASQNSTYSGVSATNTYNSSSYSNYGSSGYDGQQYNTGGQPTSTDSLSRVGAAPLSSLNGQAYTQNHPAQTSSASQYNNAGWRNHSYTSHPGDETDSNLSKQSQSTASPLYGVDAASSTSSGTLTYGRASQPSHSQTPGLSNSATASGYAMSGFNTTHQQQLQQPPQRYLSPLHAIQAHQHGHQKQLSASSGRQTTPLDAIQNTQETNDQRNPSAEPATTTVNPAAVYDNRAELQWKAQIEQERRRKQQEAELARKAEEARLEAARRAEEERIEEQKRRKDEAARRAAEEKSLAAQKQREEEERRAVEEAEKARKTQARKNEQRKKSREERRQSTNAASALQQLATAPMDDDVPPLNREEAEMRAMFKKMREFNNRNPAMLAKLWEEERKAHSTATSSKNANSVPPAANTASVAKPTQAIEKAPGASQAYPPVAVPQMPGPPVQHEVQTRPFSRQTEVLPSKAENQKPHQSMWPLGKKGHLAEAAANWLRGQPQNANEKFSKDDILRLLDENPSYVVLCESLEHMGLKFERAAFARELLRAVPEGLKAQPVPKSATPLGIASDPTSLANGPNQQTKGRLPAHSNQSTVNYEAPAFSHSSNNTPTFERRHLQSSWPKRSLTAEKDAQLSHQSPYLSQAASHYPIRYKEHLQAPASTGAHFAAPSQPAVPGQKPKLEPNPPPRPPADKEEAARKRAFGDLVDLTLEESDNDEPPRKSSNSAAGDLSATAGQCSVPEQVLGSDQLQRFQYKPDTRGLQGPGYAAVRLSETGPARAIHFPAAMPWLNHAAPDNQCRQTANAATPVHRQSPPPKPRGPSQEQLQHSRIRGKMLVEPIMRDRVARKSKYDSRSIARDVLLATGRHPDMRSLNGHLAGMQKLLGEHGGQMGDDKFGGNKSDLSTIKWDIIDPGSTAFESESTVAGIGQDVSKGLTRSPPDAGRKDEEALIHSSQPDGYRSNGSTLPLRKRGRPAKVASSQDRQIGRESQPLAETQSGSAEGGAARRRTFDGNTLTTMNSLTPSEKSRKPSTPMSAEGPVGYAAFQQYDEHGRKKKGRPVGWRKSLHSREANGLAPAAAKKPQPTTHQVSTRLVEPTYQTYTCEWRNCGTLLHNLDNLKKHLIKLHGKPADSSNYECLWAGCTHPPLENLSDWMTHIDKDHVRPIAWNLGDGPQGGLVVEKREQEPFPAYLSDASGRSVTPVISPRDKQGGATAGNLAPDMGNLAVSDPALQLQSLRQRKQAVGFTMEKNGCTLANAKRRRGFLDDEDFEDEIEEESEGEADVMSVDPPLKGEEAGAKAFDASTFVAPR